MMSINCLREDSRILALLLRVMHVLQGGTGDG